MNFDEPTDDLNTPVTVSGNIFSDWAHSEDVEIISVGYLNGYNPNDPASLVSSYFDLGSVFTDSLLGDISFQANGDYELVIDEDEIHELDDGDPFSFDSLVSGVLTDQFYFEITDGSKAKTLFWMLI